MKKVLFVASVTGHINAFHIPYLKMFKEKRFKVHVASNGNEKIEYCDKHFNLPFKRFPLKIKNIKVYKDLKKIINENEYEIIHCHTPVGGVLTRLAARKARKKGTRVIYTAHGFHFYRGASLINWLLYYPIEKICAKWTDCLITINTEDYELAKKKFKAKQIELVHGVGMDTTRFDVEITDEEKQKLKKELGIKENETVLSYVAELNKNKNQIMLINVVEQLKKEEKNVKLLLIGDGALKEYYKKTIKEKGLENDILLLGKRDDVPQLLSITDIYVASSLREGLPVNIMEAMYMELPIVAMDNRGHRELVKNNENGFLIKDTKGMYIKVRKLTNKNILEKICSNNENIVSKYLINNVVKKMEKLYGGNL